MRILVIGAGIAGLSAALRLAGASHRVTLVEREKGPIDRVCGEGILPWGVSLLEEMDLAEEVAKAGYRFSGIRYTHGGTSARGQFRAGRFGIGISRGKLDGILRRRVSKAGVQQVRGKSANHQQVGDYEQVMVADGIHSHWAAANKKERHFSQRLGLRFRLNAVPPTQVQVHFQRHHEIYLTPIASEQLSVTILLDPQKLAIKGSELRQFCQQSFAQNFPQYEQPELKSMEVRAPIAAQPRGPAPKLMLLGDACQAFDPISGSGMSFAMLCGKLAAQHERDPAAYQRALLPHRRALATFTNLLLFLRGGGLRSRLMVRQLSRASASFDQILGLHDGQSKLWELGAGHALALLKP